MMTRKLFVFALISLVATLAACGGGSNPNMPDPNPTVAPPPTTTPGGPNRTMLFSFTVAGDELGPGGATGEGRLDSPVTGPGEVEAVFVPSPLVPASEVQIYLYDRSVHSAREMVRCPAVCAMALAQAISGPGGEVAASFVLPSGSAILEPSVFIRNVGSETVTGRVEVSIVR